MSQIVFGEISPHPPILIPQIGGARLNDAEKSKKSLEAASNALRSKDFDTIVVITPHGAVSSASVPVYTSPVFEGDFANFGMPKPVFHFKGDTELGVAIAKEDTALTSRIPETILDHGALVPLYYILEAGIKKPILPIAIAMLPLPKLFEFGKVLARAAEKINRKIAVIASADMSHRLTQDAPSGFDPRGKEFDEKLVDLVRRYDVKGILNFPEELAYRAGQDALWSIAILLGALDGLKVKHEVLSYEGPFGVGYMVATFEPIS
ncbi:AmmeMemoRadiSam system protein B [Candidatus Saganbacteria bacterium]|nr:AmmeMemoRadiSam system protein B [Candidatus Saganbacteria bacterium]